MKVINDLPLDKDRLHYLYETQLGDVLSIEEIFGDLLFMRIYSDDPHAVGLTCISSVANTERVGDVWEIKQGDTIARSKVRMYVSELHLVDEIFQSSFVVTGQGPDRLRI